MPTPTHRPDDPAPILHEETLRQLRESEERYRSLWELSSDGMFLMDGATFVDCNQRISELLGQPRERIIGTTPYDHSPKRQADGQLSERVGQAMIERALAGERAEFPWLHLDERGRVVEAELSLTRVFIDGRPMILARVWDHTERRQAERAAAQADERIRALSQHLHDAREAEQKRIARELHDELGSTLTAMRLDLHWLGSRLQDEQPELRERILELDEMTTRLGERVRNLAAELRPGLLDHLGLGAAAQWLVRRVAERGSLRCVLEVQPEDLRLDEAASVSLYRILQEALTNVLRHAQASEIRVLIEKGEERCLLRVEDDGRGLPEDAEQRPEAFGLLGIRERARLLHGQVEIDSRAGQGTCLTVRFPLQPGRKEA
jgi:two-component system sensor histidine kinase UhpB